MLEPLSRLQNSNIILFWNLFTGLKFLKELNIKSFLSLTNSQYHSATIPLRPCIYSASSWSQHTLFTLCHSDQTIIITQSHSPLLPTCFTSSLEPASCITQYSSSKLFIPLSANFNWTCRFNLLHTAITFHHFFTVSLWAQNLPVQKILSSSTLVCFCLSDWSHMAVDRLLDLLAHRFLCFSCIFICFIYCYVRHADKVGQLSGQLLGAQ